MGLKPFREEGGYELADGIIVEGGSGRHVDEHLGFVL